MPVLNLKRHSDGIVLQIHKSFALLKKLYAINIVKIFILSIFIVILSPVIIFYILRPIPKTNLNYGVTFSNKYAGEIGLNWRDAYIKVLDDLRVKNIRLVAYWDEIEPEKGNYNFENIKWQVEEADKRNVNIILSMGRKVPRWPECFEPSWWHKLSNKDQNQAVVDLVKKTAEEFKDYKSIKMWQVENEPFWPFGICTDMDREVILQEVAAAKSVKNLPVLIQDSGEGGYWYPTYTMGDYLGISMYRRIWYDFWGVILGEFVYFKYPLSYWSYKLKADFTFVPADRIKVTELQAEPWGPTINSNLTQEEKDATMSREKFIDTISYAQQTGFVDFYFWGVEWWLWEKEKNNNPYFWDSAKALFN